MKNKTPFNIPISHAVRRILIRASTVAALGASLTAHADSTWIGTAGTNLWNTAGNWAPAAPGPLDNAIIAAGFAPTFQTGTVTVLTLQDQGGLGVTGGSLTMLGPSFINSYLLFSGGTLNPTTTLTIQGPADQSAIWSGGTIGIGVNTTSVTTFIGNLALSGNSDTRGINGGTVNLVGTTTWNNNPGGDNAFGAINMGNGATLNNVGVFFDTNAANPTSINNNLGGAQSVFNNVGSYIKLGTATTTISTVFNNTSTGSLDVEGGVLNLTGGGSNNGSVNVNLGGVLNYAAGTYSVANLGSGAGTGQFLVSGGTVNITGTNAFAGQLAVSGGTLNVGGALTAAGFDMVGGTVSGNTPLSITGAATWTAGVISSATTFQGPLALSGNNDGRGVTGTTLTFAGTTTWTNSPGGDNALGAINTGGGAILNNTGTWIDANASNPTSINNNLGGAQGTFNNSGSYTKTGASTTTIATIFNNTSTGSLEVGAGTLSLTGGGTSSGSVDVAAGATLAFSAGTYAVSGLGTGTGTGELLVNGGTVNANGVNSFAGLLAVSGGTLAANGPLTAATFNMTSGTVSASTPLTVTGAATWTQGTITGSSNTTFSGPLSLSSNGDGRGVLGTTINFAGTTTWTNSPGGDNAFGAINTGNGAVLNNTGTWLDENSSNPTSINNNLGGAQGTFNNTGSYIKTGTSTTTIATVFNNGTVVTTGSSAALVTAHALTTANVGAGGSLDVEAGTLSLTGGGTSTGAVNVASGAVLAFNAGTYAVSNLGSGTGTGQLAINGGTVNANGANTFAGQLAISAGTLNVNGAFTTASFNMSNGQVTTAASGGLTTTGQATWSAGVIGGAGSTTFQGPLSLSGNQDGRGINGGTVNFTGTTTWTNSPGGDNAFGAINTGGGAILNNSGTWLDENSSNPTSINANNLGGAAGTFNNSGSYIKSGLSTTTISTAFNDTGLIEVDAGAGELVLGSTLHMTGADAKLALAINGTTNNDFAVRSSATLGGEIALDFDFKPTTGEIITVFDYSSHSGAFSSVVGEGDAAGLLLTPIYNGTDFQVEVGAPAVPLPASFWLLLSGLLGGVTVMRMTPSRTSTSLRS